jgi:hypothetical protein
MSRLNVPSREQSPVRSKPLLDTVEKRLGVIPKLFRLIGLSPAALEGFLSLNDADKADGCVVPSRCIHAAGSAQ